MIENSVLDTIAESVERELDRVRVARPVLASRVGRAGNIVATHLSCRGQRVIRVRVSGGRARFLVNGSTGAVYVVDPASWEWLLPGRPQAGQGMQARFGLLGAVAGSARPASVPGNDLPLAAQTVPRVLRGPAVLA